jgi:RNase H
MDFRAGFQLWLPNWRQNGFKTSNNLPVKNASLIQYLSAHLDARALYGQKIRFVHVKGHSGEEGNEGADAQANKGALLPAVPERDWERLEAELREQMEVEQATRSADQRMVPMEVEADDLPAGNAMKLRKVSGEETSSTPVGHAGSPPKANTLPTKHVDLSSTLKLNAPPSAVEAKLIDAPSPTKARALPADLSDTTSTSKVKAPPPAVESKLIEAPSLPVPAPVGPSTSSSPRKIAESTSRIMAAIRLPSKGQSSQDQSSSSSRSPRRGAPSSKVSSVMQALFPSKSTSAQRTSSSPTKRTPSPTKIWSKIPLARFPSKTVYSKDPPASPSSLMAQETQDEDSQPSQTTQSTTTESFVTALTTIVPMSVDSPSIETAPAAQQIYPSLPEQPTKEDPPKSPARIVVNKEDIDFSVRSILYRSLVILIRFD